jgi:hypothetical protein
MWANPRRQKQRSLRLQWRTWSLGRIFQVSFYTNLPPYLLGYTCVVILHSSCNGPRLFAQEDPGLNHVFDLKMLQVILNTKYEESFLGSKFFKVGCFRLKFTSHS